jgi:hypothetical protein
VNLTEKPARVGFRSLMRMRRTLFTFGIAVTLFAPGSAQAHFFLHEPPSWKSQGTLGDPQKVGPCAEEGGTPTGVVTPFQPGETVTITLDETIFHPGHYRIALAVNDRSELPPEPPVTPGATACGSTEIQAPPVFPILADGELVHTSPFSGQETIRVTLPTNVTCEKCTLQILEFMSNHGAPCFYHHCADISIGASSGTGGSGGAGGSTTAGAANATPASSEDEGCSCSLPARPRPVLGFAALLGVLLGLAWRRRAGSHA